MYKIGIDLAANSIGVAVINKRILKYASLSLSQKEQKKLDELDRINRMSNWLFEFLGRYINKEHKVVIEDVYLGLNFRGVKSILKMQGAIAYKYYALTGKKPEFKMAISARKEVGANPLSQKAEIQLFIIGKFKLKKIDIKTQKSIKLMRKRYENIKSKYRKLSTKEKELKRKEYKKIQSKFKTRMNKYSKLITEKTSITEHSADALLLALGA